MKNRGQSIQTPSFLFVAAFKCYFFVAEMYLSGLASKVFLQPGAQK
jgi:hypothetical protein